MWNLSPTLGIKLFFGTGVYPYTCYWGSHAIRFGSTSKSHMKILYPPPNAPWRYCIHLRNLYENPRSTSRTHTKIAHKIRRLVWVKRNSWACHCFGKLVATCNLALLKLLGIDPYVYSYKLLVTLSSRHPITGFFYFKLKDHIFLNKKKHLSSSEHFKNNKIIIIYISFYHFTVEKWES